MAEIKEQDLTTPAPGGPAAPAAPPPRRPVKAGKKKMVKRLIALGVTAAIVAGETEQAVDRALKLIRVRYQVLEALTNSGK